MTSYKNYDVLGRLFANRLFDVTQQPDWSQTFRALACRADDSIQITFSGSLRWLLTQFSEGNKIYSANSVAREATANWQWKGQDENQPVSSPQTLSGYRADASQNTSVKRSTRLQAISLRESIIPNTWGRLQSNQELALPITLLTVITHCFHQQKGKRTTKR